MSLVISYVLGCWITQHLRIGLTTVSKPCLSIILGSVLVSITCYYMALVFGFQRGAIIGQVSIILLIAYVTYEKPGWWHLKIPDVRQSPSNSSFTITLAILAFFTLWLLSTHIIQESNDTFTTGESSYSDLPFHLTIISQLAYGHIFPPEHPFFSGLPLAYPYLVDFFSAILVNEGWTLRSAILIPGALFAISLFVLVFDFAYALTKNHGIALLTLLLFVLNGGLGFYYFLHENDFAISRIYDVLSYPPKLINDYSHLPDHNIHWATFLTRMMVPERSILFGIPVGLIILRLLFFRDSKIPITLFEVVVVSLLIASMPLLHTHTVLVFTLLLPLLALFTWQRANTLNLLRRYSLILILVTAFGLPHLSLFLSHVGGSESFFRFQWGWMKEENESFASFWLNNGGLLIPLSFGIYFWPTPRNREVIILHLSSLALFLLMNTIIFQPYAWDNIKFLLWIGIFFALSTSLVLCHFWKKGGINRILVPMACIILTASAGLSLYRELYVEFSLFDTEAIRLAQEIRNDTPRDAIFLTPMTHNSFVSNLAGRRILMGPPGMLWVHGIHYDSRVNDIHKMYAGSDESKELFHAYGVKYVLVPSSPSDDNPINQEYFRQFPVFRQTNQHTIYSIE